MFLHLAEHSFLNSVCIHIGLDLLEHLIVLGPIVLKTDVVFDNQINHVQIGQNLAQIVKNGPVADFLERLLINGVFRVEESVHLQEHVFG